MKPLRTTLILVASALAATMVCCGCSDESPRFLDGRTADPMTFEYTEDYMTGQGYSGPGGADNIWSSGLSGGNYDPGNQRGYVGVPGHGPVGYGY